MRIVKRESERRQRDRDKCCGGGNIGLPLTNVSVKCIPVIEESDYRVSEKIIATILKNYFLFVFILKYFLT